MSIRSNGVVRGGTTAALTVEGFGGGDAASGESYGVRVQDSNATISSLGVAAFSAPSGNYDSSGGDVNITGNALGSGTGVFLQSGGDITAGGFGTVTVDGSSDSGFGLYDLGLISSRGGDVQVTGVSTSGTGVTFTGASDWSTASGDLTVNAGTINLDADVTTTGDQDWNARITLGASATVSGTTITLDEVSLGRIRFRLLPPVRWRSIARSMLPAAA